MLMPSSLTSLPPKDGAMLHIPPAAGKEDSRTMNFGLLLLSFVLFALLCHALRRDRQQKWASAFVHSPEQYSYKSASVCHESLNR